MLNRNLITQIQDMFLGRKLSLEQIGKSLKLPDEAVAVAIRDITPSQMQRYQEINAVAEESNVQRSEKLLAKHLDRAAAVIGELVDDYAEPSLQFAASKFIMEVGLGKHRAENPDNNNNTVNIFNTLISQGQQVADEHEKRIESGTSFKPINTPRTPQPQEAIPA